MFDLVIAPTDLATIYAKEYLGLVILFLERYSADPLDSPTSMHSSIPSSL